MCEKLVTAYGNNQRTENMMLTRLCDVDPLTPHFYIVKLGFTGVYIIFIFCSKT